MRKWIYAAAGALLVALIMVLGTVDLKEHIGTAETNSEGKTPLPVKTVPPQAVQAPGQDTAVAPSNPAKTLARETAPPGEKRSVSPKPEPPPAAEDTEQLDEQRSIADASQGDAGVAAETPAVDEPSPPVRLADVRPGEPDPGQDAPPATPPSVFSQDASTATGADSGADAESKAGTDGQVRAAAPSAAITMVPLQSVEKTEPQSLVHYPYSVLLDTYNDRASADKYIQIYRQKGLNPFWVVVRLPGDIVRYRLFSGHFSNTAQAGKFIEHQQLKNAEIVSTRSACRVGIFDTEADYSALAANLLEYDYFAHSVKNNDGKLHLYAAVYYTEKGATHHCNKLISKGFECEVVKR